jgi:hypothetical protein
VIERASAVLDGRLINALGALGLSLIVVFLFFVVSLLVKRMFKKSIDTSLYYLVAVVIGALGWVLIPVLALEEQEPVSNVDGDSQVASSESSMYAPFIPPNEDELESFIEQLDNAITKLPPPERDEVITAIGFLSFALAKHIEETDPESFQELSESDLAAKTYVRLYKTAQKHGPKMSLSKYVELANEFKKVKPEVWEQYESLANSP